MGATYIVLVAVYARPLADDWWHIAVARQSNPFTVFHETWLLWSDRFSGFVVLDIATRLLGALAVNVVPLLMLVGLWALSTLVIRGTGTALGVLWPSAEAGGVCLLGVIAVTASSPSLYDTLWLSGASFYLGSVLAATAVAAWCAHLINRPGSICAAAAVSVCAGFVASGFHEIVGAVLILAALLGAIMVRLELRARDRRRSVIGFGGIAAGSAAGIALNLLGAGSMRRAADQNAAVSVSAAFQTAGHNLTFIVHDVHDGVLLLALATGVTAWSRLGSIKPGRPRQWLLVWAAFMALVPWLVTSALTAWGGSNESGDRSPFRAGFLETGSMAVAAAMLVVLALSRFPRLLDAKRAAILALVLVAGGLIGVAHKTAPVLTAERMRDRALSLRANSIRMQLQDRRRVIDVTPAPLLTVDTQVYDLSFGPPSAQRGWVVQAFRMYYRIPIHDRLRIAGVQPRGYCIASVDAAWVGVRSCQELDAGR